MWQLALLLAFSAFRVDVSAEQSYHRKAQSDASNAAHFGIWMIDPARSAGQGVVFVASPNRANHVAQLRDFGHRLQREGWHVLVVEPAPSFAPHYGGAFSDDRPSGEIVQRLVNAFEHLESELVASAALVLPAQYASGVRVLARSEIARRMIRGVVIEGGGHGRQILDWSTLNIGAPGLDVLRFRDGHSARRVRVVSGHVAGLAEPADGRLRARDITLWGTRVGRPHYRLAWEKRLLGWLRSVRAAWPVLVHPGEEEKNIDSPEQNS